MKIDYLLDTSVLVEIIDQNAAVQSHLITAKDLYVSSVALGELYYGAQNSTDPAKGNAEVDALSQTRKDEAMVLSLLPPADYGTLQQICAPLNIHLAVAAMLAGETPAQIYVDELASPTVALLLHWNGHRVYLAGTPHDEHIIEEIRKVLFSSFTSHRSTAYSNDFLIYYASPAWETCFPSLCQGVETMSATRHYYVLSHAPPSWQSLLPTNWRLRQIDATLLAEQELQYLPELIEEMHSESPSREDFLAHKFGYCLQEDQTLIGWCLSEYNHADRCEVGIATALEYRRRGGACIMASALIAHALETGITQVGWHCWSSNTASGALARKLGGTLAAEYPVCLCRIL